MKVTVTEGVGYGCVTVYRGGGGRPLASNLNFGAGSTVPNAVVAKVGAGGRVCLFVSRGTNLLGDLSWYVWAGSFFVPLVPARLLESREGGQTVDGNFNGIGPRAAG